MKIKISEKFIVIPVNNKKEYQKLILSIDGLPVYTLNVRLDFDSPAYLTYMNVERFIGCEADLNVPDNVKVNFCKSIETTYNEPLRPQIHFSPKSGWINDPNGLIYINGEYHMFFQHNPVGTQWGNMHWGHTVSKDLLHWKELDIALYPDEFGTMYSGSAIFDHKNNMARFYYTAAGEPYTQCMAVSDDGGKTLKKYDGNPIIGNIIGSNRDPKVIFCPELDKYVLALYLDENTFALFSSENLIDWEMFQKIDIPFDSECPDFYKLDGKWVLSAASDYYLIGDIIDGKYAPSQSVRRFHKGDSHNYAAQTFSGIDGRVVRISWNRMGMNYMPFNMCMSFPVELSLKKDEEGYALCAEPIREIELLYTDGEGDAQLITGDGFKAIVDRNICELFTDEGSVYTALSELPAEYKPRIKSVQGLKSIWR